MSTLETTWLAASYHIPSTYSCRLPMSSPNSAMATPAPGPATVRLAMIRSGIELFGHDYVRDDWFPIIRSVDLYIKPPSRVAISTQLLRAIKASPGNLKSPDRLTDSLMYREVCHAEGEMTIYIRVPVSHIDVCRETLEAIGYWGQANSLAWCTGITASSPRMEECGRPLKEFGPFQSVQPLFSCIVSDFRDKNVKWDEIVPTLTTKESTGIRLEIWVWPLVVIEQRSNHKLLASRSLASTAEKGSGDSDLRGPATESYLAQ